MPIIDSFLSNPNTVCGKVNISGLYNIKGSDYGLCQSYGVLI
jgi:hypothetical protein